MTVVLPENAAAFLAPQDISVLRGVGPKTKEILEKLSYNINEIELSVRSTNCLQGANIETIAELVIIPERKMLEFRNFGKKSLNEIKAKLQEMGLSLGMDLKRFDITYENVKDKVKILREEVRKKKNGTRDKDAPVA